jgi:GT2 family glycosyltransferase
MDSTAPRDAAGSDRIAILVLGMHRSGTSALTRVLNLLGVDLGDRLLPAAGDNRAGFWEHREIVLLHERLLARLGTAWDDPTPLPASRLLGEDLRPLREELGAILARDFGRSSLWGLKDPRLCRLVPLWTRVLTDSGCELRAVLVLRSVDEVAASLLRRNGLSEPRSRLLWLTHCLAAESESRGLVRSFVTYDGLLADWRSEIARVGEDLRLPWGDRMAESGSAIDAFLDPGLRHHGGVGTADPLRSAPHPWLEEVETVFRRAAMGRPEEIVERLDRVRERFEEAGRLFFPAISPVGARPTAAAPLPGSPENPLTLDTVGFPTGPVDAAGPVRPPARDATRPCTTSSAADRLAAALLGSSSPTPPSDRPAAGPPSPAGTRTPTSGTTSPVPSPPAFPAAPPAPAPAGRKGIRLLELPGTTIRRIYDRPEGDPRVTLVLPLHNRVESATRCLEALAANTPEGSFEIVLVDDGSTDGTDELLACLDGNVKVVVNERPLGYSVAGNQGAVLATTEFLLLLGPDVEVGQGWLDPLLETLDGDPGLAAVELPDAVAREHSLSPVETGLLVRRSVYEEVDGFDGTLQGDVAYADLLSRIRQRGWRIFPRTRGATPSARRPEDDRTSIVVLTRNQLEHTRHCVTSIRRHTPAPYELILVDNGSTDGTVEYLGELAERHDTVRTVFNRENLGFARGNNQGFSIATGRRIVVLNNDTAVTQGWLEGLASVLTKHRDVGIVGPVTNRASGPQVIPDVPYRTPQEMEDFAREIARSHAGRSVPSRRLVGFCWLMRKEVLDAIGGFDERFGLGNFEDDDFCLRAFQAGWRTRIALDVFIHHVGTQTFVGESIDYRQNMRNNFEIFKEKWGMDPAARIEDAYPFMELVSGPHHPPVPLPTVTAGSEERRPRSPEPAAAGERESASARAAIGRSCRIEVGMLPGREPKAEIRDLFHRYHHEDEIPVWSETIHLQSQMAEPGLVLLVGPDVVLGDEVLSRLVRVAVDNPDLGAVGPVSNAAPAPQRVRSEYSDLGRGLHRYVRRRGKRHRDAWEEVPHLGGFCLLLRTEHVVGAGGLNEELSLADALFDLFPRLRRAGHPVVRVPGAYVHHSRLTEIEGAGYDAPSPAERGSAPRTG